MRVIQIHFSFVLPHGPLFVQYLLCLRPTFHQDVISLSHQDEVSSFSIASGDPGHDANGDPDRTEITSSLATNFPSGTFFQSANAISIPVQTFQHYTSLTRMHPSTSVVNWRIRRGRQGTTCPERIGNPASNSRRICRASFDIYFRVTSSTDRSDISVNDGMVLPAS